LPCPEKSIKILSMAEIVVFWIIVGKSTVSKRLYEMSNEFS